MNARNVGIFAAVALMAAMVLTECAERDFAAFRADIGARGHYIEGVPFYRQKEDSCGPAALAAVASFWGREASPDRIASRVYMPKLRGTLPMDMESYLREAGFGTASSSGTLDEMKTQIRKNVPVISLLDLGFGLYRKPHYVTVIGYDDAREVLIVHDGVVENRMIGYDRFMKQWGRAGNWMLVARPKTTSDGEKR